MKRHRTKSRWTGNQPKPPKRGRHSPKNSWTSPKAIERQKKIAEALEYRRAGHSYPVIAKEMGVDPSTIYDWVIVGMEQIIKEPAEAVLLMELARLDEMQAAIYADAAAGDRPTIDTVTKLMERRARYMGLDKPQKTASTDPEGNYVAPAGEVAPTVVIRFTNEKPPPEQPKSE